eukprot:Hpha_TRINITY_DN35319_c0_g1::TRINITY_DN35319_c0_g1_i1::g.85096::m.85096
MPPGVLSAVSTALRGSKDWTPRHVANAARSVNSLRSQGQARALLSVLYPFMQRCARGMQFRQVARISAVCRHQGNSEEVRVVLGILATALPKPVDDPSLLLLTVGHLRADTPSPERTKLLHSILRMAGACQGAATEVTVDDAFHSLSTFPPADLRPVLHAVA